MLTVATLTSTSQAVDYYSNYYIEEHAGQGEWFGKSAKLLNLKGKAKLEDFIATLEGKLSSDIVMGSTTKNRRPGYDLTFSAPKSVSILALIANDQNMLDAHRIAVNNTLDYLEKNFAATRVKSNGVVSINKTDNLLITKFEHIESRALDPELHTHAIVMNVTYRSDQKWRTLYFDWVYDNKMLLGVIYRGELAQALMQFGYEITQISEKGLFELKDFSKEMLKLFSKRRNQITDELKNQGFSSSKAAQIANFSTRDRKVKVESSQALKLAWNEELKSNGFSLDKLQQYIDAAKERGVVTLANPYALAVEAITKTAKDLSDWHGVFTIKELLKQAGWFNISNCSVMLLEKAIAEQFKSGSLLYLANDLCTTQNARDLEIANIVNMRQAKNKIYPMFSKFAAIYLSKQASELKELQLTLKTLLTNTDQQIVVTAKTATNYTVAIKSFVALSYKYNFNPIGITQTYKRKETLAEELGLKRTQTIKGFLISCSNRLQKMNNEKNQFNENFVSKQIWILDFHSKISSSQLNALQTYAKRFNTRIIWSNKFNKPQAAISALLKYGIKECCLDNEKSDHYISTLMCHPNINQQTILADNNIDKHDWQRNTANCLVHWSITKHQQYDAVFSLKKLQLDLFSLGITIPKEVLQAELDREMQKSLITVKEGLVTTKDNLALEQACLQLIESRKTTIKPIVERIDLPQELTKGQQQAIQLALTTCDGVVGIQGVAGSGKTTMLRSLNKLCKDCDFEIIGITPTTSSKERLQAGSRNLGSQDPCLRSGIKTMTVRKFLIESQKLLKLDPTLARLEYATNKLLVLDEASFVSTAEMFAILTKVEQLNSRIVVMGDHRQLSSVEAGKIFYLMLGSNMQSIAMTENIRFKSTKTLNVMQHIYKNQIPEALQRLSDSLVEIPDHKERIMKMAELYLAKNSQERQNTILITPEHADRKLVNDAIRQGLKNCGQLSEIQVDCYNLTQVKLTTAEQQKVYYFKEQNLITFSKSPKELNINNYEYYFVKHKNLDKHHITLQHSKTHEQIIWEPARGGATIQIYRQEKRGLMTNEQIRWLRNNEVVGIYNGQTATIKLIDSNSNAVIVLQNGTEIQLNLNELSNQHWDYAYAATTFMAQGKDTTTTIALAKGGYSKEILTKEIKVGNVLMIKRSDLEVDNIMANSKLVKVIEIYKNYTALVQSRDGINLTLDLKKSPTDLYCKDQAIWQCYPDPTTRKEANIPKLTSVEEFLVSVTRGDQVILLVDHIESYQHALEYKLYDTRSALELCDPNHKEVRSKVDSMMQNITGIAPPIDRSYSIKLNNARNSLYPRSNSITIEQVITKLHSNILQQTTTWLGQPQKINNEEARWGKKGSLVVKLSGKRAGFWHDFEKSIGGQNLLSLYMKRFNRDFKMAISELSTLFGIGGQNPLFNKMLTQPQKKLKKIANLDPKKIEYVNKIYNMGINIAGTLAEKYLREFRGITGSIPGDFRFCKKLKHPDLKLLVPALIVPIKNAKEQIQGIVRIFLNKQGNKLNENYLDHEGREQKLTIKANLGSMVNAAVTVNYANNSNDAYIAEGIETALSVAQAKPYDRVIAALSVSNLKNVTLPLNTKRVILCADHDGVNTLAHKALLAAANFYQAKGLQVAIAYPEKIPGMQKFDFNDVLKHLGVDSISKSIQNANYLTLPIDKNLKATTTSTIKNMQSTSSDKELSL